MQKQGGFTTIFLVTITCILAGGLFGAVTNMINGIVSPYYFQEVLHANTGHFDIVTWAAGIGLIKGLLYGLIFSIVFTTGFGIITKGKAGYMFALKELLRTASFVCLCWIIGGLFAILLTSINPDFYRKLFPITPKENMEMLKFAWVGGSIWGGIIGGLLSAILGVVLLRNKWIQLMYPEE